MKKKIRLSIKIISIIIITIILVMNLKNIHNILPKNTKLQIKEKIIINYEGLSDNNKILIRALGLEPFKHLQLRYKRTNPKIANLNNDYNVKFLPETQYGNFNLSTFSINFKKKGDIKKDTGYSFFQPFYIEIIDEKLLIINNDGEILFSILSDLFIEKQKNLKTHKIKTNLKPYKIMGTLTFGNIIYISYLNIENNCQRYNIASSQINFENLVFETIFTSDACGTRLNAGRMKVLNHNGQIGLLVTIGGEELNQSTNSPQDFNSDIGKLLFINLTTKEKIIFSSGHRNPQGLYIENNLILATEHGPRGGDEINKINFGKNYGWPISSYGKQYTHVEKKIGKKFLDSHSLNGFEEPIYSFIPSIGISQIIKIPNEFSKEWKDNYLLASLNGASLYRIKFNNDFSGIIYMEKIFIDRRIRDLKYSKKNNAIILTLEDWQEIGIFKPILDK